MTKNEKNAERERYLLLKGILEDRRREIHEKLRSLREAIPADTTEVTDPEEQSVNDFVQDVDLAEPKEREALVRIEACGVCHTDLYAASGADPTGYTSCVLGHEGAGVVEAVGPGTTFVAPGDHVVTLFAPECGECIHCRDHRTNRCIAIRDEQGVGLLPDGTTRFARNGDPLRHFMGTSTFAEATVMAEIALAKVDPEAPLDSVPSSANRIRSVWTINCR